MLCLRNEWMKQHYIASAIDRNSILGTLVIRNATLCVPQFTSVVRLAHITFSIKMAYFFFHSVVRAARKMRIDGKNAENSKVYGRMLRCDGSDATKNNIHVTRTLWWCSQVFFLLYTPSCPQSRKYLLLLRLLFRRSNILNLLALKACKHFIDGMKHILAFWANTERMEIWIICILCSDIDLTTYMEYFPFAQNSQRKVLEAFWRKLLSISIV